MRTVDMWSRWGHGVNHLSFLGDPAIPSFNLYHLGLSAWYLPMIAIIMTYYNKFSEYLAFIPSSSQWWKPSSQNCSWTAFYTLQFQPAGPNASALLSSALKPSFSFKICMKWTKLSLVGSKWSSMAATSTHLCLEKVLGYFFGQQQDCQKNIYQEPLKTK